MDWVKPKHRARQMKQTEISDAEVSASVWLKQLCEENVAILQSSLPMRGTQSKLKPAKVGVVDYLRATTWGTGVWEVESDSRQEYLNDLQDLFGTEATKSKGKKAAYSPSTDPANASDRDVNALQSASATKIGKWISQQLPKASYDPYVALACAGWIHALPEAGRSISPALWLEVLQSALTQVDRAWESGPTEGLFPWIIWACEIPLALAKQLSHLGGKDRIVSETLNRIRAAPGGIFRQSTGLLGKGRPRSSGSIGLHHTLPLVCRRSRCSKMVSTTTQGTFQTSDRGPRIDRRRWQTIAVRSSRYCTR